MADQLREPLDLAALRKVEEEASNVWQTDALCGGPVDTFYETFSASTVLRLLAELEEARRGWQPIETAPKDGTQFWAFDPGRNGYSAQFVCWWHEGYGAECYWTDEGDSEPEPTHWQPLPAAPARALLSTSEPSDV